MQVLAEAFVIPEEKRLILSDRATKSSPELVTLKQRSRSLVKVVRCVKRIVPQEFVDAAVQFVGSGLRDNGYLSTGPLAVFGAIGITQDIELAHGFNA